MSAPASYALPPKLDLSTAAPLASALAELRGQALVLDAGAVTHFGTPGLQVLLSARKAWQQDDQSLLIENMGDGLAEQLTPLGLRPEDLMAQDGALPEADSADSGLPPLPTLSSEEG